MIVGIEDGASVLTKLHDLAIRSGNSIYERGIVPDLFHVLTSVAKAQLGSAIARL